MPQRNEARTRCGVLSSVWFYHQIACAHFNTHALYSSVSGTCCNKCTQMFRACTHWKGVKQALELSHFLRRAHTHRRRFKQTHLCFIALICLVYSCLTDRSTEPHCCNTIHTNTHKVDKCRGRQSQQSGNSLICIWMEQMICTWLIYTYTLHVFLLHFLQTHHAYIGIHPLELTALHQFTFLCTENYHWTLPVPSVLYSPEFLVRSHQLCFQVERAALINPLYTNGPVSNSKQTQK